MQTASIAILGAGAWGTAMAMHLARADQPVLLWSHQPDHVLEMQRARCNARCLPNNAFPEALEVTSDLNACFAANIEHVMLAVPSHAFSQVLNRFPHRPQNLVWLTKGIDPVTHHLLHQVVEDRFGANLLMAMISGPSFASEVAKELPTAIVIASNERSFSQTLKPLFEHHQMRVYLTDDLIGVQWAGAIKNILAIACGISDGLQFGANAKAALITRGLAEMRRFACHLGAQSDTFLGLAGVGDLVLTCTDDQSRNRRFGLQVGQGVSVHDAEKNIGQVVEGKHNAALVCALAKRHDVDMPICQAVHDVLTERCSALEAAKQLMHRSNENHESK